MCNKWRAHLRGLAPEQHSSEKTSQQWEPLATTVSNLTGPGIKPRISRTDVLNHLANRCIFQIVIFTLAVLTSIVKTALFENFDAMLRRSSVISGNDDHDALNDKLDSGLKNLKSI